MMLIVVGKCEPNEVNPCDNQYLGTPKEACHPCAKELWNCKWWTSQNVQFNQQAPVEKLVRTLPDE